MLTIRTHLSALLSAVSFSLALAACSGGAGDPFAKVTPNPLGTGHRISQISNPGAATYAANGSIVNVSSASVTWLDTFDETSNGKSKGTLYIQDVGSKAPFSGMSLYKQTLVPANETATPGDVFNLSGTFSLQTSVGSAVFGPGQYLVQISNPTCTFEYEYAVPDPVEIPVTDLGVDFNTGLKWTSMLVKLTNVTLGAGILSSSGRVTYSVQGAGNNPPDIANELYNLGASDYPAGTVFSSITGIVTWFEGYEIAPRSAADLVVAPQ